MKVGLFSLWQHGVPGTDDRQLVREEMALASQAEELEFDFVGVAEHHFEDYSMACDAFSVLSYLAAKTDRIGLMTAVAVLPWHDPVRVAEHVLVLDHLSNGRVMFGIGRGLAPKEYAAFQVDQNEARERFDELGPLILDSLETGVLKGEGPFYPREPIELRPGPFKTFAGRTFGVSNSPSSAETLARLRARQGLFVAQPLQEVLPNVERYRETWRGVHDDEPPAPLFCDYTFCSRDAEEAERARTDWFPRCWNLTLDHYQLQTVDFTKIKGYEAHSGRKDRVPYSQTQIWGTPEEIIGAWEERLDAVGGDAMSMWNFRFGGMPYDAAARSMNLFAEEVLPKLKKMGIVESVGIGV